MLDSIAIKLIDEAIKGFMAIVNGALKRKNDELLQRQVAVISTPAAPNSIALANAIDRHLEDIRDWASHIIIADATGRKSIHRIYVELTAYVMPLNTHLSADERGDTQPLLPTLQASPAHAVILGSPGAGSVSV
jgi:hypothetical protein